jgi:LEA14-like dessication related protein
MYRDAARQLNFTLESVEPRVELSFPLERSRIVLRIQVGVNNPSSVHFKLRGLGGRLSMDEGQNSYAIGSLNLPQGLDLPPSQRAVVPVDLSFTYEELKQAWKPLSSTITNHRAVTWRLEGEAQLNAMGFPITIPVRTSKNTGRP